MNDKELAELREHFDTADLSHDIETAAWDRAVDPDPMVVTSLRLPKSLLDWVREQAEVERVKPTALIRRWIEDRRGDANRGEVTLAGVAARLDRLESVTLHVAEAAPSRLVRATRGGDAEGGDVDDLSHLLEALRRSVEAARDGDADGRSRRGA